MPQLCWGDLERHPGVAPSWACEPTCPGPFLVDWVSLGRPGGPPRGWARAVTGRGRRRTEEASGQGWGRRGPRLGRPQLGPHSCAAQPALQALPAGWFPSRARPQRQSPPAALAGVSRALPPSGLREACLGRRVPTRILSGPGSLRRRPAWVHRGRAWRRWGREQARALGPKLWHWRRSCRERRRVPSAWSSSASQCPSSVATASAAPASRAA